MQVRQLYYICSNLDTFENTLSFFAELKESDAGEITLFLRENNVSFASLIFQKNVSLEYFYATMDSIKLLVPEIIFHAIIDFNCEITDRNHLLCEVFSSFPNFESSVSVCFDLIEKYYNGNYYIMTQLNINRHPNTSLFKYITQTKYGKKCFIDELEERLVEDAQFDITLLSE